MGGSGGEVGGKWGEGGGEEGIGIYRGANPHRYSCDPVVAI